MVLCEEKQGADLRATLLCKQREDIPGPIVYALRISARTYKILVTVGLTW